MAAPPAIRHGAGGRQLGAKLGVIVDFAVERQHEAAVGRQHRLVSRGRQVDDRQPAVAKADSRLGVDPQTRVIGAAMRDRARHALEQTGV